MSSTNDRQRDVDWVLVQRIERDICYLYHELTPYCYIMGDLYWGSVYALPYWEYLDFKDIEPKRTAFICEGCLILILAMAFQQLDGAGDYIRPHLADCRQAVRTLKGLDDRTEKLAGAVRMALDAVARNEEETTELYQLGRWVYQEFVLGYFRQMLA